MVDGNQVNHYFAAPNALFWIPIVPALRVRCHCGLGLKGARGRGSPDGAGKPGDVDPRSPRGQPGRREFDAADEELHGRVDPGGEEPLDKRGGRRRLEPGGVVVEHLIGTRGSGRFRADRSKEIQPEISGSSRLIFPDECRNLRLNHHNLG
jgi:hypothetical protein